MGKAEDKRDVYRAGERPVIYNSSYSSVVEIDGTEYLIQGKVDDELTMFRSVDNLLECERDAVQCMMLEVIRSELSLPALFRPETSFVNLQSA